MIPCSRVQILPQVSGERKSYSFLANRGGAVVEQSTHDSKFDGSDPAPGICYSFLANRGSKVVEQLTHDSMFKGSNPAPGIWRKKKL
jgi:hypothetical protein